VKESVLKAVAEFAELKESDKAKQALEEKQRQKEWQEREFEIKEKVRQATANAVVTEYEIKLKKCEDTISEQQENIEKLRL
jgi:DNA segregation ATPase FtsK/SpoIIIE-like protein